MNNANSYGNDETTEKTKTTLENTSSINNKTNEKYIPGRTERKTQLGYKPQKEIVYNFFLPYSDKIDAESEYQWREIKKQMCMSVLLRDPKVAGLHWTSQISKYIKLYGFKFSLEDHVRMSHLLLHFMQTPGMEYSLIQKYASTLSNLLRKKELVSRRDLVLPWRPFYRLMAGVLESNHDAYGLIVYPENTEVVLRNLIRTCRIYFSKESTREMLEEWKPMLCPHDTKMADAFLYMETCLPTLVLAEERPHTFHLWFDDFMSIYHNTCNNTIYENNLVTLFSRLARDNVGCVDWEPHLDVIFTRVLSSFNLPVGSDKVKIGKLSDHYSVNNTARWIVNMITPKSKTLEKLDLLFKALHSFYHPSNHGAWTNKLLKFPKRLCWELVLRLEREKYRPTIHSQYRPELSSGSWEPAIEEEYKLTDNIIDQFVNLILKQLLVFMFSKSGSQEAMMTFKYLSSIRPQLVVPPLLDSTYSALETLTEPHRLISCLQCTSAIIHNMVLYTDKYPEGRTHVLPLMRLCLPGIDPNDLHKSMMTFRLLSILALVTPIIDFSGVIDRHPGLTELEKELCLSSSQFEDVVMQFFDRVIALIETSSHQHTRADSTDTTKMSQEEAIYQMSLFYTSKSMLCNCSEAIFKEVVNKLRNLSIGSVFEHKVAGPFVAKLVRAAIKLRPELVLPKFVPHCTSLLIDRLSNDDLKNEEHLDSEILWNLLLLSEVFCCHGKAILPYKDDIIKVLDLALVLKCKDTLELASSILKNTLKSLTSVYVIPKNDPRDEDVVANLPIKTWGHPGNITQLDVCWHEPSEQQFEAAMEFLNRYLLPRLDDIKQFCAGTKDIEKEELKSMLLTVQTCVVGVSCALPMWQQDAISLADSPVSLKKFDVINAASDRELKLNGENIRLVVADHMMMLINYLLVHKEDDTKSFIAIIKVVNDVMNTYSHMKEDFRRTWHDGKIYLENKLLGKKKHLKNVLLKRIQLQHETRAIGQCCRRFTHTHLLLYQHLFKLATSRYVPVRKLAQMTLGKCFRNISFSYRPLLDQIVTVLSGKYSDGSPVQPHEFKGVLYLVMGDTKACLLTKRNWFIAKKLWPAFIASPMYSKPSLLLLHNKIVDQFMDDFETYELRIKVSQDCIALANEILKSMGEDLCDAKIQEAAVKELEVNKKREKDYLQLVDTLVDIAQNKSITWKFTVTCYEMLTCMNRIDIELPQRAVQLFVQSLNSDHLPLRRMGIVVVTGVLQQLKRSRSKVVIDINSPDLPYRPGNSTVKGSNKNIGGNSWLQYDQSLVPKTAQEHEDFVFIDKTYVGYFTWDKYVTCHDVSSKQPALQRGRGEMKPGEQVVYDFFMHDASLEKFIDLLIIRDEKDKNKYSLKHHLLFKALFRNFDVAFLPQLIKHANRLIDKDDHVNKESNQRCASEIVGGLLKGSKHWNFQMREEMWREVIAILNKVMSNMTVESTKNWGSAIIYASEDQDPRRLHPLFHMLAQDPIKGVGGSAGDASRLFLLECAMVQQEWRMGIYSKQVGEYLMKFLDHPYKNVRDMVASMLVNIHLFDAKIHHSVHVATYPPSLSQFTAQLVALLQPLSGLSRSSNDSLNNEVLASKSAADQKSTKTIVNNKSPANEALGRLLEKFNIRDNNDELDPRIKRMIQEVVTTQADLPEDALESHAGTDKLSDLLKTALACDNCEEEEEEDEGKKRSDDDGTDDDVSGKKTKSTTAIEHPNKEHKILTFLKQLAQEGGVDEEEMIEPNDNHDENYKRLIRIFKTVLKIIQGIHLKMINVKQPNLLQLMPLLASMEGDITDPEMSRECTIALISTALTFSSNDALEDGQGNMTEHFVNAIKKTSESSSWKARLSSLTTMQRWLFRNLFLVNTQQNIASTIRQVLLDRLSDKNIEVRELAGVTLSGLFQCGYLQVDLPTAKYFKSLAATKISKKRNIQAQATSTGATLKSFPNDQNKDKKELTQEEAMLLRHSGVIGLCACVNAHPYDVPPYLPDILMSLTNHLHDPQPIQGTVKRSLTDFKRTHLDNWSLLKHNFTENQLVVLTELLVSPNYYA